MLITKLGAEFHFQQKACSRTGHGDQSHPSQADVVLTHAVLKAHDDRLNRRDLMEMVYQGR